MAFLRELIIECDEDGYSSEARVELLSRLNAYYGKFCRRHGLERLKRLLEFEKDVTKGA